MAVTLLLQDREVELSIPADPGRVFHPVWRPQHIFLYQTNVFFLGSTSFLCHGAPDANPFQPISGPCSIEIIYPREWQIAIPASLMRVENISCAVNRIT